MVCGTAELIAAAHRHEDLGLGRVLLDFLPQAINVGLDCMGGDAGVIAPHLVQDYIPGTTRSPAQQRYLRSETAIAGRAKLTIVKSDT